jgi:hypothetical protein
MRDMWLELTFKIDPSAKFPVAAFDAHSLQTLRGYFERRVVANRHLSGSILEVEGRASGACRS